MSRKKSSPDAGVSTADEYKYIALQLDNYIKHLQQAYYEKRGTPDAWRYKNVIEHMVSAMLWLRWENPNPPVPPTPRDP